MFLRPTAELRLHKTVRRLFVEQRDLAEPVTLDYTTFASAVTASGMSRIWGGIHWPADEIQGRALGEHVGENAWQRARQFVLGTASPAAAVLAFLRRRSGSATVTSRMLRSRPPVGSASTCRPAVTRCGAASSSTRCRQATMS
jgi:hypothetical protein